MSNVRWWSEAEDDLLKVEWASGASASQIAKLLYEAGHAKRSRNSVIGRIFRKGLPHRKNPNQSHHGLRKRTAKKRADSSLTGVGRKHPVRLAIVAQREVPVFAETVAPLNVTLDDLHAAIYPRVDSEGKAPDPRYICRAVTLTDDRGLPRYCGHGCHFGQSFCDPHLARFYQPALPRRRADPYDRSRLRAAEAHL